MRNSTKNTYLFSIGIDLGDKYSDVVIINRSEEILHQSRIKTTRKGFSDFAATIEPESIVVIEVGSHSPWINDLFEDLGIELVVANSHHAGKVMMANGKKNDLSDAFTLAYFGFCPRSMIRPIIHRTKESRNHLALIRARDDLVRIRTTLINAIRGLVKSHGDRLPACSSRAFAKKIPEHIPLVLEEALLPMVKQVGELTQTIKDYDKKIEALIDTYPKAKKLTEIDSVAVLTAMTFLLTIDDPSRFKKSRTIGAYLGLTPRQFSSGEVNRQLRITKAGDNYLRKLLVGSAQYILSRNGKDCNLKRYGERIGARGGANGKKRAVVAVARKLSVLMHKLLVSDEQYDPFFKSLSRGRMSA